MLHSLAATTPNNYKYRGIQFVFLDIPVSCFIHGNASITDAETSGHFTSPQAPLHDWIPTTVTIDLW